MDRETRIKEIIAKIKEYEWKDREMWEYWRSVLYKLDPHNPYLELGFHGLPYFTWKED